MADTWSHREEEDRAGRSRGSPGWWSGFPVDGLGWGHGTYYRLFIDYLRGHLTSHWYKQHDSVLFFQFLCNNYSLAKNGPSLWTTTVLLDFWPSAWVLVASSGCQLWYMGGLQPQCQAGLPNHLPRVEAYFCASGNTASDPKPYHVPVEHSEPFVQKQPASLSGAHVGPADSYFECHSSLVCGPCWETHPWETPAVLGGAGAPPNLMERSAKLCFRTGYHVNTGHLLVLPLVKAPSASSPAKKRVKM